MQNFSYYRPVGLSEFFNILKESPSNYKILAGGTDLLVRLKTGRVKPQFIIDIKDVSEIAESIQLEGDHYSIGALTLMANLEAHPDILRFFPALAEAVHSVGSMQIRNRATIAGNICNASPAADSVPALIIYNAELVLQSASSERNISVANFITGPGKTALEPREIVREILLPLPSSDQAAAFTRLTRRKGVDLATINICCQVTRSGLTRFVLGAVGPTPVVVEENSGLLTSASASESEKKECIAALMLKATPISDVRASKEYRQAMLAVLGYRALTSALERLERGA